MRCRYWRGYKLTFYGPSRIATVKNAMGNSVSLVTDYEAPAVSSPWSVTGSTSVAGPQKSWTYEYDYGSGNTGTNAVGGDDTFHGDSLREHHDHGANPDYTVAGFPKVVDGVCKVGTCTYVAPQNLIGKNASRVNWGLTQFADNVISTLIDIDTTDGNKDLEKLLDYFLPYGADGESGVQGLNADGGTPTRAALAKAQKALVITANRDPKITKRCKRPYGVVLVTDGLSNYRQPIDGNNWIKPCNVGGPTDCDKSGGGLRLPDELGVVRRLLLGPALHEHEVVSRDEHPRPDLDDRRQPGASGPASSTTSRTWAEPMRRARTGTPASVAMTP